VNLGRAGLLARKEWKESFNSPTPYIALGLFFILIGCSYALRMSTI
jgi:energy-converting hydrogenase Eha subunit A